MKKRVLILCALAVFTLMLLTGCVPGDGTNTAAKPAGLFWGIWHGWLAPVSLVIGFFNRSIRVYEVNNTGWFYDLGYYIAVISGFGGLSFVRKKNNNKDNR